MNEPHKRRASLVSILGALLVAGILPIGEKAHAVELECPAAVGACPSSVLWVSGKIEEGDARKIATALKERGPQVSTVILASSPGGLINEAMKVGRLIRRLHLFTSVGWPVKVGPTEIAVFYPQISAPAGDRQPYFHATPEAAVCESACVFVWVSGEIRYGYGFLAVHKGTFRHLHSTGTPAADLAEAEQAELSIERDYLAKMDAPDSLWDQMRSNDALTFLNSSYVSNELEVRSPSLAALTSRECGGSAPTSHDVLFGRATLDDAAAALRCEAESTKARRAGVWQAVIGLNDTAGTEKLTSGSAVAVEINTVDRER